MRNSPTPAETVFVRVKSSGAVIKMDVPTDPQGRERYDAAIAKRELALVDADQVEEVITRHGGKAYQMIDGADVEQDVSTPERNRPASRSKRRSSRPQSPDTTAAEETLAVAS